MPAALLVLAVRVTPEALYGQVAGAVLFLVGVPQVVVVEVRGGGGGGGGLHFAHFSLLF